MSTWIRQSRSPESIARGGSPRLPCYLRTITSFGKLPLRRLIDTGCRTRMASITFLWFCVGKTLMCIGNGEGFDRKQHRAITAQLHTPPRVDYPFSTRKLVSDADRHLHPSRCPNGDWMPSSLATAQRPIVPLCPTGTIGGPLQGCFCILISNTDSFTTSRR